MKTKLIRPGKKAYSLLNSGLIIWPMVVAGWCLAGFAMFVTLKQAITP